MSGPYSIDVNVATADDIDAIPALKGHGFEIVRYAFVATDLIAHKGLGQVLPFPVFIAAIAGFSIWFAGFATRKGWVGR